MLNSFLSKILAALLVSMLCGAIITAVLSQTVLNAHYLDARFTAIDGYSRLSGALTNEVAEKGGVAGNPELTAQLNNILAPNTLKQRINGALDQLQLYYGGKGQAPSLNLSDLAAQAQAAGVPAGQLSSLTQPITLSSGGTQAKNTTKSFDHVKLTTIIASMLLIVVLLFVSWEQHRYTVLPNVLINVGILMGLVSLICYLGSSLADHYIKFYTGSNAFASIGRDLADNIAHDLGHRFAVIAAVCFVVGMVSRIVAKRLQVRQVVSKQPLKSAPNGAIRS